MVRYRLTELIAERRFRLGRRVTLAEVAAGTGVLQSTLSRMANQRANVTVDTLEKVCRYFGVGVGDLVEFPDQGAKSAKMNKKPSGKR